MIKRPAALVIVFFAFLFISRANDSTIVIKNTGLKLPAGFSASLFLDSTSKARHIVVAKEGVIFVKIDKLIDGKGILRLKDSNGDGKADEIKSFGNYRGTGIT